MRSKLCYINLLNLEQRKNQFIKCFMRFTFISSLVSQHYYLKIFMEVFIKLKKILKNKRQPSQFQKKLVNYQLTHPHYLSLLLTYTIELNLEPFNQYLHSLLGAGANINFAQIQCKDESIQASLNILMYASYKSNFNIVAKILQVQSLELNFIDSKGRNPIYYALLNQSEEDSLNILKLLLEKRKDFIAYESYKTNYLKICIQKQRFEAIKHLILNGLDSNTKILETGRFPIQQVIQFYQIKQKQKKGQLNNLKEKQMKIIMFFIENGADLDLLSQSQISLRQLIIKKRLLKLQQLEQLQKNLKKIKTQKSQIKSGQLKQKDEQLPFEDQFLPLDQDPKKDLKTRNQTIQYNKQTQVQEQDQEQCNLSSSLIFDSLSNSSDNYCWQNQQQQENDVSLKERLNILTKQIQQFANINQKIYENAWHVIQPFVKQLQFISKGLMLRVDLIGSFATGLWTPFSDIDFVLITNQPYIDITNTLGTVYQKLKKLKMIKQICFIEEMKFPNIKILLSDQYHNLKIQVSIFHIKNNGFKYVQYINEATQFFPQIKPIFFFMRALLQKFKLHDRNKRGLKTYTLFLMIYYLMHIFSGNNLGELLLNITRYYGFTFDYNYEPNDRNQIVRRLNIVDPLNFSNNAGGKNIDIDSLENMFRLIYYGIQTCPVQNIQDQDDQKNQINNNRIQRYKSKENDNWNINNFLKTSKIASYLFQLHKLS